MDRNYEVEFMGIDDIDMYEISVMAKDIESAYKIAWKKRDRKTDRIISIIEVM